MKKLFLILGLTALIGSGSLFAQQEITYPGKKGDTFSVTFPKAWKVKTEPQMLTATAPDGGVSMMFWALTDGLNLDHAGEVVQQVLDGVFESEGLTVGEPDTQKINGVTISYFEGKGKAKESDVELTYTVGFFTIDGEPYFTLFYFGSEITEKKWAKDLESIVKSIKAK